VTGIPAQAAATGIAGEAESSPTRIALVAGNPVQPDWVARIVTDLLAVPGVDVFAIIDPQAASGLEAVDAMSGPLSELLFAAFARYDRRVQHAGSPGLTDIREALRPERILDGVNDERHFAAGLYLGAGDPDEALCARFEHGVLTVRQGPRAALPAAREVLAGAPVLHYSLLLWRKGVVSPSVVTTSSLRTNRVSVAATADQYQAHLAHMLVTRLTSLGRGAVCSTPDYQDPASVPQPLPHAGGIVRMARSLTRLAARRIEHGVRARLQQEDWALAVVRAGGSRAALNFDPRDRRQQPTILLPPVGRIWADPFPLRRDDRTYVFFEEMERSTRRGHISLMELTERLQPRMIGPVLSAGYHLSYPFVFEWKGSLFMLPETEQNRTVELHRCVAWPDVWTLEAVLLDHVSAADATIVEADGKWWMFTTMNPRRDADWDTNLYLFHSTGPLGPWMPHACNPIKSDVRSSRSAGRLFWQDGRLYRPAQDCAERYGHAIVINEITRLDTAGFNERQAWRVDGWRSDIVGVHTVNQERDVLMLDCRIRRRKQS
jgi:hypothetical protein